jgi:hypothetical protein
VKKKVLILAIVLCVLALVGVGGASAGGGEDFDAGTEAAIEYEYCFLTANDTVLLKLDFDGQFVMGEAVHASCGAALVLGDVDPPYFYLYRDWETDSPCVEGVWSTNQLGGAWGYEWINTSGGSGTGTNTPVQCPP